MIFAQVIAELIDAGLSGDALKAACRRIEAAQASFSDAQVTPGALRQRRYMARKSVTNDVSDVTMTEPTYSSNNTTLSEIDSSKELELSESVTKASRKRHAYSDAFETFWKAYPVDAGMSKADAFKEFKLFGTDDQDAAIKSLPAFKAWIPKQGNTYRVIHACNFLKQRRFDGFAEEAAAQRLAEHQHSSQVYVQYGTEAGDAWERHYRMVQKKPPPRDSKGGWYFPTEYPETPAMRRTA